MSTIAAHKAQMASIQDHHAFNAAPSHESQALALRLAALAEAGAIAGAIAQCQNELTTPPVHPPLHAPYGRRGAALDRHLSALSSVMEAGLRALLVARENGQNPDHAALALAREYASACANISRLLEQK